MGTNCTVVRQRKRHVGQMNGHEYKHSKHVSGSDSPTAILPHFCSYKNSCPELHCNQNLAVNPSRLRVIRTDSQIEWDLRAKPRSVIKGEASLYTGRLDFVTHGWSLNWTGQVAHLPANQEKPLTVG